MSTPTMPAEAVANPDGTWTIPDPTSSAGDWTIYDTGEGWTATHPRDGWGDARFATATDVAVAILGTPLHCRMWDGSLYGEADR